MKTLVYIYDPNTKVVNDQIERESNKILSENETLTKLKKEKSGFYQKYYKEADEWRYHPDKAYRIDEKGFLIEEINMPQPVAELNGSIIEEPLDKNLQNPRWNGKKWEDKPIANNLFMAEFDQKKGEWIESAKPEEIKDILNSETDSLIKEWCKTQGKNEEYYLNKGIENGKDDLKYQDYLKAKNKIKADQKKRKAKLGAV